MLTDIAQKLNLAPSTVSMCLSGNAAKYKIKPETIARVLAYANEIGYVPSRTGQLLSKGTRQPPIGLLLRDESCTEKRFEAFQMVSRKLETAKRDFVVHNYVKGSLFEAVASLKSYGIHDLICFFLFDQKEIDRLEDVSKFLKITQQIELFFLDSNFPFDENESYPSNFHFWGIDRKAVYRRLLMALQRTSYFPLTVIDYELAHIADEIDFTHKNLLVLPPPEEGNNFEIGLSIGKNLVSELKKRRVRRCMILVRDDRKAAGIINILLKNGYKIPREIQILGFDNIEAAPYLQIPLSSIDLPLAQIASEIVDVIIAQKPAPHKVVVTPRIFWRESCLNFLEEKKDIRFG